ncbi:MAG: hypothetical protein IJE43_22435 [Alphaproteobacteria bacterium]|nr:hypothetical protein [Alphaproteobacteria bacterium]
MRINEMICEHCGKKFYSEYYTGGYIDHYENFSSRKNSYGKDVERDIEAICFDGNDIRDNDDIQERLSCYLKWDNISDETKTEVKDKCEFLIDKIQKAKENARNIVNNMTMLERKYLIKEAEDNCSTPFGDEDGKLWQ